VDVLLALLLAVAGGTMAARGARRIVPAFAAPQVSTLWFEADPKDYYSLMTDRLGAHGETRVHPLFSFIGYVPVKILKTLGLSSVAAIEMLLGLAAAVWAILVFAVLRLMGASRPGAVLFSLLALSSASAMFWFVLPETWVFGSLTILCALLVAALAQHRRLGERWYTALSAVTLSVTTTNWMAGIAAAFARFPRRRALQVTANAFCIVVLLSAVQLRLFPRAKLFLDHSKKGAFVFHPRAGGPSRIVPAFVFHSVVMPAVGIHVRSTGQRMMVTQPSPPGSAGPWAAAAVLLWAALLGAGVWGFARCPIHQQLRWVVGLTLAGQLALHLVYGEETFLYSLHWLPLLIVLSAFGLLTPARRWVMAAAVALLLCLHVNNHRQFEQAAATFESLQPLHRTQSVQELH
jgi:hypothetical protein